MNCMVNLIAKVLLSVIAGIIFLCSTTMARDMPGVGKIRLGSAAVYSRADKNSAKVTILNKDEPVSIQIVLDNGTDRWCAIANSKNEFIGYVLCDQLKAQKSRSEHAKRMKPATGKPVSEKPSTVTPSDNAQDIQKSGTNTDTKANTSIMWLTFAGVFLFVVLVVYLVNRFKIKTIMKNWYETSNNSDLTDSSTEAEITKADAVTGLDTSTEPVTVEKVEEFKSGIKKGEESNIGTLVKCRFCDTVQILGIDAKCINCRAALPNDEVKYNKNN